MNCIDESEMSPTFASFAPMRYSFQFKMSYAPDLDVSEKIWENVSESGLLIDF